ncbi:Deoxyribonuclease II [Carpediemonas membranifera]|uniref:Deoxyribonuclease II n=1 Tax=Carpediemonas membranifera TaxID=201153 RepID=A0A8J6EB41_9EUKA|nr:Deoxyribonuclease II [Carpediemonas membranifera]|eukprot:KAG9396190.1 Deoxyribonuclease II [Carpediemonas membranifera]
MKLFFVVLVLILSLFSFGIKPVFALSCLDESGKEVDWFVAIKMPILSDESGFEDGDRYMFIDENHSDWQLSEKRLTAPDNHISRTINQVYDQDIGYVMYNDEPVDGGEEPRYAHAKGVMAWSSDDRGGFWMPHSVPRFPHPRNGQKYLFPDPQLDFGQSFFCMSVGWATLGEITTALRHNKVYLIGSARDTGGNPDYMTRLLSNDYEEDDQLTVTNIETSSRVPLTMFSKSGQWGKDLYDDGVAPEFKSDLVVETWMRPFIGSVCHGVNATSAFSVVNSNNVAPPFCEPYHYTKDHSKIAISLNPGVAKVCIGDINRNTSQYSRGGGTVCIHNADLWNAFYTVYGADRDRCK